MKPPQGGFVVCGRRSRPPFASAAGLAAAGHGGERGSRPACTVHAVAEELTMPKGVQRSNKLTKKPKKDSAPLKEVAAISPRPTPPTTTVMPKGKLKNKPA